MVELAAQGNEARHFQSQRQNLATKPMFRDAFKNKRCLIDVKDIVALIKSAGRARAAEVAVSKRVNTSRTSDDDASTSQ